MRFVLREAPEWSGVSEAGFWRLFFSHWAGFQKVPGRDRVPQNSMKQLLGSQWPSFAVPVPGLQRVAGDTACAWRWLPCEPATRVSSAIARYAVWGGSFD